MSPSRQPWASGPAEILEHGLSLLAEDSDRNRRLAMIAVDNALELMIKTYLGLPQRVTSLSISRKELDEASESFPKLLGALERHAATKLDGIDLGEIEWYHRLRNQLYHQGNGLTVERQKVAVYAELTRAVFRSLYGFEVAPPASPYHERLGAFLAAWIRLERALAGWAAERTGRVPELAQRAHSDYWASFRRLIDEAGFSQGEAHELELVRRLRNGLVHGDPTVEHELTSELVGRLDQIAERLERTK